MFCSGDAFIKDLRELREQLLLPARGDLEKFRTGFKILNQLPHNLGLARYAVRELFDATFGAMSAGSNTLERDHRDGGFTYQEVGPELLEPIAHAIDAFFDAARRTQNAVIPYISKRYSVSLSPSLSKLQATLRTKGLPEEVVERIEAYWQNYGVSIKAYRDLGQHVAVLAPQMHLVMLPSNDKGIALALPNNPDCKAVHKLSYDPPVLPLDYIPNAFLDLVEFVTDLTKAMLVVPLPYMRSLTIAVEHLSPSMGRIQRVSPGSEIDAEIDAAIAAYNAAT